MQVKVVHLDFYAQSYVHLKLYYDFRTRKWLSEFIEAVGNCTTATDATGSWTAV